MLLLWAAVDLSNPALCALDGEPFSVPAAATTIHAVDGAGVPASGQPEPHIDDCFCCSRCVEPAPFAGPIVTGPARQRIFLPPDRIPLSDHASVYHPPQFLA